MRNVFFSTKFERKLLSFTTSHPELKRKVRAIMSLIVTNPFDAHLKTHKLSGSVRECLASSINYKYRIVFILADEEIQFVNIGSHDEVY